jgi:hypothetical protein
MTAQHPHPDFLRAPAHRRWSGGVLRGLLLLLDQEARTLQPEARAWRILPGGAQVSLWFTAKGRRIRIARSEKPKTDRGPDLWRREIDTFARDFGVSSWTRGEDSEASGIAVILAEPAEQLAGVCRCGQWIPLEARAAGVENCVDCALQVKRGFVRCARCGVAWVRPEPAYDVQQCNQCAFAAGREYTLELNSRRTVAS